MAVTNLVDRIIPQIQGTDGADFFKGLETAIKTWIDEVVSEYENNTKIAYSGTITSSSPVAVTDVEWEEEIEVTYIDPTTYTLKTLLKDATDKINDSVDFWEAFCETIDTYVGAWNMTVTTKLNPTNDVVPTVPTVPLLYTPFLITITPSSHFADNAATIQQNINTKVEDEMTTGDSVDPATDFPSIVWNAFSELFAPLFNSNLPNPVTLPVSGNATGTIVDENTGAVTTAIGALVASGTAVSITEFTTK